MTKSALLRMDPQILVAAVVLLTLAATGCGDRGERDNSHGGAEDRDESRAASNAAAVPPRAGASVYAAGGALGPASTSWTFDSAQVGQPPIGFSLSRTGAGRPGRWVVRSAPDAPSPPNVLAQEDDNGTDYRFPVAVADAPTFMDVSVSVRCKPVSGRVDQACGLVFRYLDENNYYLTRANALEDNVNLYYVQGGRRREITGRRERVASGVWHTLQTDALGDHVEVYFDGRKVIGTHDTRITVPGKVGVWTKADSQTLFDDLSATPLDR